MNREADSDADRRFDSAHAEDVVADEVRDTNPVRYRSEAPILRTECISLSFGGVRALIDVGFDVLTGEILSIIGPNGAGKTSMANVISGLYRPTSGRIFFKGQDRTASSPQAVAALGIARTFQNLALFRGLTVIENILVGRHLHMRTGLFAGGIHWGPARREELENRRRVEEIVEFLNLTEYRTRTADTLPYGLQKRVELGRSLAAEPAMLILDEPMAGMNRQEKEDMVRVVVDANVDLKTTIILIEHDMSVVMDISDRVVVLDHGEKIAEGDAETVRQDEAVIRAYLGQDA
ncbi:MAG: ABC transporter ATP-binding protein [Rhodospirillaceae bacterium]|nr:ABC transporter ATP-binding protein [Rhodospirillaceae bacterium]MDE0616267.1 ABC transporter ATP-binding protein [Rhodospirillaceae bacterium]